MPHWTSVNFCLAWWLYFGTASDLLLRPSKCEHKCSRKYEQRFSEEELQSYSGINSLEKNIGEEVRKDREEPGSASILFWEFEQVKYELQLPQL